ncbi:type II toxin-antitoxin system HipA family toxin [Pseudodesulfovibrio sp. JC047]|uniref:type II toxin-antitoxin system HipA family toxin n=1 Tax=Pseudodesulfovibrio sp. JC047 TaxID=2683199 RepID=UPI0013D72BEB|nr:type II toxin-antitoxin system HipA family toxin [Pseudodesulfovibrio sp. JC047]NDV18189.1 type II toxin-antitoxin system HipA family toxin [Pseudodesulfovibrio sp. JC047]
MSTDTTYVYIHLGTAFVPAGLLSMHQTGKDVVSSFAYGRRYLARKDAAPIDPLQLPLGQNEYHAKGLFRAFHDASPDGWGRHLLDRAAESEGVVPSEFDYLTVLNQQDRIGALAFGPDLNGPRPSTPSWRPQTLHGEQLDLERMLQNVDTVLNHEALPPDQRRFLIRGSSVGGAQPKATIEYEGRHWIAKFSREFEHWPTCRIELAARNLAARCGIRVPTCKMIEVGGRDIFLTERFDRGISSADRIHFLSSMTLIGSDSMTLGTYGDIALALRRFGMADHLKDDLHELFRRMVFNILCNNWDDHLKNHGFLYDIPSGKWRLSPAYDIVPQPQRDGNDASRLTLGIGKHGRVATLENALSRSQDFALDRDDARQMAHQLQTTVRQNWKEANKEAGVSTDKLRLLEEAYRVALQGEK